MQALKSSTKQRAGCLILSALLAFPTFALAQDPPPAKRKLFPHLLHRQLLQRMAGGNAWAIPVRKIKMRRLLT